MTGRAVGALLDLREIFGFTCRAAAFQRAWSFATEIQVFGFSPARLIVSRMQCAIDICGRPIGRFALTQLESKHRGARCSGIRATCPAHLMHRSSRIAWIERIPSFASRDAVVILYCSVCSNVMRFILRTHLLWKERSNWESSLVRAHASLPYSKMLWTSTLKILPLRGKLTCLAHNVDLREPNIALAEEIRSSISCLSERDEWMCEPR